MVPASLKTNDRRDRADKGESGARAPAAILVIRNGPNAAAEDPTAVMIAKNQSPMPEQYVTVREDMFFIVTQRTASGEQQSWQVHMVAGEHAAAIQNRTKTPKDLENFSAAPEAATLWSFKTK